MKAWRSRLLQSPVVLGLVMSAAVCTGIIGLRQAGALQAVELAIYDHYLQYSPDASTPENRILLVTISENDIQKHGSWPIGDGTLALVLENLLAGEPRVIGLDVYRNIRVPPGSPRLEELFSRQVPVTTVRKLGDETSCGVPKPYMVGDDAPVGFNDLLVDVGGSVRRGLLFMDDGETVYTSFALLMAQHYLEAEGILPESDPANPEWLKLGKATLRPLEAGSGPYVGVDARGYQFLFDFPGVKIGYSSISLTDVLEGSFAPEAVRGKIVLVGTTAESLKDYFFAPIEVLPEHGGRITGIELHAAAVSQLLRYAHGESEPLAFWSDMGELGWIVLWGLAGYVLGLGARSFGLFVLSLSGSLTFLAAMTFILFRGGLWVPVAPPAMACIVSAGMLTTYLSYREKSQRAILMQLFANQVSRDVARVLWEQKEQFIDGGRPRPQELVATVLFTDLKGFTTLSEKMDVQALIRWLNEYMEAMAKHVMDHGGVVNKYMGDAIMAVFGVPVARTSESQIAEDATRAVSCAVAMGEDLERLNGAWRERNRPVVKMRVGIFTGPLMVGCIGSSQRLEYTVIGDTVNIASRLESLDKDYAADSTCRILIGESTLQRLDGAFEARELGAMPLKGKDSKIKVYHVLGERRGPG